MVSANLAVSLGPKKPKIFVITGMIPFVLALTGVREEPMIFQGGVILVLIFGLPVV